MSDYIPLTFESLPNEIFHELFDYMTLTDLIRIFLQINSRFQSILFSSNIHLRVLYPDDIQRNVSNRNFLLHFLSDQRYLSRLRLDSPQLNIDYQLIHYSQIRSLIIDIPTAQIFELLTPTTFPRLEYLRLGYSSTKNLPAQLYQNIFSNAFPCLKKCSLNHINDQAHLSGSPRIYSLGICSDNPATIVQRILVALNHLRTLHLFLTWPSSISVLDQQDFSPHEHLKSVQLHMSGSWTLEKLDSLLTSIPTVKYLGVYSSYFDSSMTKFAWNFSRLAYIFLCRLPRLCLFDCDLICAKDKLCDIEQISSFHSSFHRIQYEISSENDSFIRIFT